MASRAYNSINSFDVTSTPIVVRKSQSVDWDQYETLGIEQNIYRTAPKPVEGVKLGVLGLYYYSIKQLFYKNYESGSIETFTTASAYDNFLQSTAGSGSDDSDNRIWPNSSGYILSIPRSLYGESIGKGTLTFFDSDSDTYRIHDDANGNLIVSSSTYTGHCGNVFYNMGLAIVTRGEVWLDYIDLNPSQSLQFESSLTIYENVIRCRIGENDFNYTLNPSAITGSNGQLADNVSGSDFNPYATTIGLYNDKNELLVVGKFGMPLPIPRNTDITVQVKYDM